MKACARGAFLTVYIVHFNPLIAIRRRAVHRISFQYLYGIF